MRLAALIALLATPACVIIDIQLPCNEHDVQFDFPRVGVHVETCVKRTIPQALRNEPALAGTTKP
jgi:hypothetical protein